MHWKVSGHTTVTKRSRSGSWGHPNMVNRFIGPTIGVWKGVNTVLFRRSSNLRHFQSRMVADERCLTDQSAGLVWAAQWAGSTSRKKNSSKIRRPNAVCYWRSAAPDPHRPTPDPEHHKQRQTIRRLHFNGFTRLKLAPINRIKSEDKGRLLRPINGWTSWMEKECRWLRNENWSII